MRRMTDVWPSSGTPDGGVDRAAAQRSFDVRHGDLLVMHGDTQKHWHHRVPKAPSRCPRINLNFWYIVPGSPDVERGQKTYYKYMVHGDSVMPNGDPSGCSPPSSSYTELLRRQGSLFSFVAAGSTTNSNSNSRIGTNTRNDNLCDDAGTAPEADERIGMLRSILGSELPSPKLQQLLDRNQGDMQRAIDAHFSNTTAASGPEANGERALKRPKTENSGGSKQRSVLAMWGAKSSH